MPEHSTLRTAAESRLAQVPASPTDLTIEEMRALVHELQVQRIELEMQNEELRLMKNRVFDAAMTADSIAAPDGIITEANETFVRIWGYACKEEVIGHPVPHFFIDQREAEVILATLASPAGTGYWQGEFNAKRKDGSAFLARGLASVVRDGKGKLVGYHSSVVDITDARLIENALRQSEKRYRNLHESMRDAIATVDMSGRFTECNRAFQELLGYTAEELGKLTCVELTPAKWHAFDSRRVAEQILPLGCSDTYEKEFLRKDGSVLPVDLVVFLLRDAAGQPAAMRAIVRDITERKQAEEIARLHSLLLTNMAEGVIMVRMADGLIVYANPKFEDMFGYGPDELLGRNVAILNASAEHSAEAVAAKITATAKAIGSWKGEVANVRKDGSEFYSYAHVSPFDHATHGRVAVTVQVDISDLKRAQEALRKSEELLNAIQHLSKVGGWLWDIEQQSMFWTAETYRIHGYAPDEVGTTMDEHIAKSLGQCDEADRPWILAAFRRCVEHGEAYDIEYPFTTATGRRLWVCTSAHAVWDGSRITQVVGNIIDLTERKQAEQALRESSELLSLFMRCSPIFSYIKEVTATESRVLYASENFHQLIGTAASQMAGKPMSELFPAEFAAKMTADDLAVVSTNTVMTMDEDFDGRNFTTIKFPIVLGDKTLLAGYTMDITERRQAEQAQREWSATLEQRVVERTLELRDSEARFRQLAEATFEGIAVSEDGILVDGNLRLAEIHGYELREMIGRPLLDFIAPESQALVLERVRDGSDSIYECLGLRKDGAAFPTEVHARMGVWMGRPTRISALRDLTAAKQAAATLRAQQAELAHAQHLALVSEVSAGIIHQLGQPLSAIGANLSAIVKLKAAELERSGALAIIRDVQTDVARMRDIVVHLRALANPMQPTRVVSDFNAIVAGVLPLLRQKAENRLFRIVVELGEDLPAVHADTVQMSQVILNLVRNAFEAAHECPPKRRIVVVTTRAHGESAVELRVRDSGSGIAPETMSRLFNPFFSTKPDGLGVGLRLSQTIVQAHGGSIEGFNNPDGPGATFRIVLPAIPPEIPDLKSEI